MLTPSGVQKGNRCDKGGYKGWGPNYKTSYIDLYQVNIKKSSVRLIAKGLK